MGFRCGVGVGLDELGSRVWPGVKRFAQPLRAVLSHVGHGITEGLFSLQGFPAAALSISRNKGPMLPAAPYRSRSPS